MKQKILTAALVIALVIVFFTCCKSVFGEQYVNEDVGKTNTIHWEYVNLRENHSQNSDIVNVLHKGDTVTLTGYSYEYLDGPSPSWSKVITEDNKTGWIVTNSIQW